MNSYPAKVGRTVTYRTATGQVLPAVITSIAGNLTVTAASRTSNIVTLTVNNSLAVGGNIVVELNDASFNGVYQIASANGTTITYTNVGPNVSGVTGTARDADFADLRVGHHGEVYLGKRRRSGVRGALNINWNDRWSAG